MQKPTIEEIRAYIIEKNLNLDAEAFFYHYDAKGWKTKSGPMVRWRSSVALWGVQGWGKTSKSDHAYKKRNNTFDDVEKFKERMRDKYGDFLRGKTTPALEDLRKDPGQLKPVTWLIEEIFEQRKALGIK